MTNGALAPCTPVLPRVRRLPRWVAPATGSRRSAARLSAARLALDISGRGADTIPAGEEQHLKAAHGRRPWFTLLDSIASCGEHPSLHGVCAFLQLPGYEGWRAWRLRSTEPMSSRAASSTSAALAPATPTAS